MPCLIPRRIINPKYKKIASLSDNPLELDSYSNREDYYIDVSCGRCFNCRKSYRTQWNLRLQHEYNYLTSEERNNSYFITLTFNDMYLPRSPTITKETLSPYIRKFLERIRKSCGKSVRHWIVSEYGDDTHRLHFHGFLINIPFPVYKLEKFWKYGFVSYKKITKKRITYCTNYLTKMSRDIIEHPKERQFVFTSPGIGKRFCVDPINIKSSVQFDTCVPFVYLGTHPFAMPRYYRKKIFNDFQREQMTENFFHFSSEDVIPPPPYFIGNNKYEDYTLYLRDLEPIKKLYNKYYVKSKSKSYLETSRH